LRINIQMHKQKMTSLAFITLLLLISYSVGDILEANGKNDEATERRLSGSGPMRKRNRSSSDTRIVGGTPAGVGAYPFIVSLYNVDEPDGKLPVCGGTLITPNVVLTAAHCILDIRSAETGRYDYDADEPGVETFTDLVRRRHPDYDANTFDYDYALIKLDRPHPDPFLASLRTTPEIPQTLIIMGWGLISDGGEQSDVMLEAEVRRFGTDQCETNYAPDPITENMFCANEDGIDACQGDSGGPIVIPGTNVQVGLTSWGIGCANATFPGVYARTSRGYPWIEETICGDLSPEDCNDDDTLPIVGEAGVALERTCEDREEFLGLGKKLLMRNCSWVETRRDRRCPWYGENYCPATCEVDRCS